MLSLAGLDVGGLHHKKISLVDDVGLMVSKLNSGSNGLGSNLDRVRVLVLLLGMTLYGSRSFSEFSPPGAKMGTGLGRGKHCHGGGRWRGGVVRAPAILLRNYSWFLFCLRRHIKYSRYCFIGYPNTSTGLVLCPEKLN